MRPQPTAQRDPVMARPRALLALLVSAQLVVMLDVSIVNVALPSIQADLATSPVALTWVVNAYALAFGGLLLLAGRATDLFGRRRLFVAGSAVFTAGTLLAAVSDQAWQLIAARAVQGVGASALSPAALSLLVLTFQGPARARAMGMWSAASAVGGAAGVVAGGVLAGSLGWRATFLVTVPITLAAALIARKLLAADQAPSRSGVDGKGVVLLAAATIAMVHGVLDAAEGGWVAVPVLMALAVAATSSVAFLLVERRSAEPLVPLELFRSRTLPTGVGTALLGGAARASTFVLTALYLQQAVHLSPMRAGLAMVPTSATVFVVSLLVLPRLLRAHGVRRTMITGLLVLGAGHLWLAHAPGGTAYAVSVLPGLVLVAVGVALSFTPTTIVVTSAVPPEHTGLASGLAGSATQVGAALGTAAFVSLGVAAGGVGDTLTPAGFAVAFTAAAVVAVTTAALATLLPRPTSAAPRAPRRRRRAVAAVAVAGIVIAPAATRLASSDAAPAAAAPTSAAPGAVDLEALDRFVAEQIEAASIPGAAVAVTHDDQVIHMAGFGRDAEGGAVTPHTLFRVASLSKSFTALAVMQLVDDDQLGLDDPVADHLPEFRTADPRGKEVTVRQLLGQTSGLADSTVHPLAQPQPATLVEAVETLADVDLASAPGTLWSYHNPNYQVAARLVEVVAGQSFDSYLRDHVFAPAGMGASTTVGRDDDPVPGLADGHVVGWGHAFAVAGPGTFDGGDGGVVSNVSDMARWLVVQTNHGRAPDGTRILSRSSLAEQHTAVNGANGYALGWDTDGPVGAPTRLAHSGNLLTYSAYMEVLPGSGYGVVLLLNAGSGLMVDQLRIFHGLSAILEGAGTTTPMPPRAVDLATLDLVLGAVTVGVALLGLLGVGRAARWSRTVRTRTRTSVALRTAPHALVLLAVLLYPHLAERLVGGREVTWEAAAYGWPALTTLVVSLPLALAATWLARGWQAGRRRLSRQAPVSATGLRFPRRTGASRAARG